jgi:hypothetical protein
VPGQRRGGAGAVDHEVVSFRFDPHRHVERLAQLRIGIVRAQRRTQIDLLGAAQASVELPGGGRRRSCSSAG